MKRRPTPPEVLALWRRWKALARPMRDGHLVDIDELFAARERYFRALDAAALPVDPEPKPA